MLLQVLSRVFVHSSNRCWRGHISAAICFLFTFYYLESVIATTTPICPQIVAPLKRSPMKRILLRLDWKTSVSLSRKLIVLSSLIPYLNFRLIHLVLLHHFGNQKPTSAGSCFWNWILLRLLPSSHLSNVEYVSKNMKCAGALWLLIANIHFAEIAFLVM